VANKCIWVVVRKRVNSIVCKPITPKNTVKVQLLGILSHYLYLLLYVFFNCIQRFVYELLKFKEMKNDIEILLKYLREFTDAYNHSEIYLNGEDEDSKMLIKIKEIANKHGLKF
jgi:histone deacetylase complex regulatory component SIN3